MIPSTHFTWKSPVDSFVLFGEPNSEFWVALAEDGEQLQPPYTTLWWHHLNIAFTVSISNAAQRMTAFSPAQPSHTRQKNENNKRNPKIPPLTRRICQCKPYGRLPWATLAVKTSQARQRVCAVYPGAKVCQRQHPFTQHHRNPGLPWSL